MLGKTLCMNFCYLKIIHILHPHYHPKIIEYILENPKRASVSVFHEIIRLIIMKIKMKMKNTSHRYDINRPRSGDMGTNVVNIRAVSL